jgi:hypothetical protein
VGNNHALAGQLDLVLIKLIQSRISFLYLPLKRTALDEIIEIRASSKRNGFTTALIGIVALVLSATLMVWLPAAYQLTAIFLISASIVTLIIGWFKIREPAHSLILTRDAITYMHRFGQWEVNWQNIQRIDIPSVQKGLEHISLGLVGIKLKQYDPLLSNISPRLANNLLLEQRPLLLQNKPEVMEENISNYGANLIEDDRFKSEQGKEYKGIQAMYANRMSKLRERLGYDLYISEAELDRPVKDFVALLRECQQSALTQDIK